MAAAPTARVREDATRERLPDPALRDASGTSDRPVHVMHVVYALQPGGMEFGVVKVVNGLNAERVRSSICSTVPAVPPMRSFVSPAVPVFELRRRPGNDPRLVWDLYRLFRRERPDIVHTHAWGTLVEGLIAARMARVPMIIHGEHGTLQLRPYQARLQQFMWRRADKVLSVSLRLAEKMASSTGFPHERITTIQNGVDLSRFSPRLRESGRMALGLPAASVVIGTAGRLVPVKDHANLLEALAAVRRQGAQFTALIAGDGPLRQELQSRIDALELRPFVRLLGQRNDIERVFAALDIFVLPSKSEGMSNTILEAMASGAPVVATRVGGADELVEDGRTGMLVPPEDAHALADAVASLIGNPLKRARMQAAALAKGQMEFSLGRMLRDYEGLYVGMRRA